MPRYTHCVDCGEKKKTPNYYPRCKPCSKKLLWQDKEYREKQRAYRDDPEFIRKQREAQEQLWADEQKRQAHRELQQEIWSDPELRARHSETLQTSYAEVYADSERYAEICAKLEEFRKANWADPEYRERHSRMMTERNGANYGDETDHTYDRAFTEELREEVRERDYRRCVLCGKPEEEIGKRLDVHHINYDKHDSRAENLIPLCPSCHWRTNHNRTFWQQVLPLHFRQLKQDWQRKVVVTAKKGGLAVAV